MKKHQFILAGTLIFVLLFYKEGLGINLAVFGLLITASVCYFFQDKFENRTQLILVITSVLSCFAFAWFGDISSFFALFLSVIFLQFKVQENQLKIIQVLPLIFLNGFTSIGRIFMFKQWLPERKIHNDLAKKIIAYLFIPVIFIGMFFIVYSFGSNLFSSLFTDYTLDINLWQVIALSVLGLYLSFSFWNYWIPEICYEKNEVLDNDFKNEEKIGSESTFSFLDIDFERKSGEITLFLLNVMLLIFIVTYNYEQFFEVTAKANLSSDTHERVNAVIFSIVMAVGVILFYFKGGFNFDKQALWLKNLAKIWMLLNGVLILSAIIKNSEYIMFFGLTYKRLGVYLFLLLSSIGLILSYKKIARQKTNFFLFNHMIWYLYGTILVCSFFNWGNLITMYNISVNKGVDPRFLSGLNFNDEIRRTYFLENSYDKLFVDDPREGDIQEYQKKSFLSKALYYEFLNDKK